MRVTRAGCVAGRLPSALSDRTGPEHVSGGLGHGAGAVLLGARVVREETQARRVLDARTLARAAPSWWRHGARARPQCGARGQHLPRVTLTTEPINGAGMPWV